MINKSKKGMSVNLITNIKKQMTKRERVESAMSLQQTDRVPVYDLLLNDAVIQHFSGKFPPLGEAGIKVKCAAINKMLDMTRAAYFGPKEVGEWVDEEGFVRYREDRYINGGVKKRPFHNEKGARNWLGEAIQKRRKGNAEFDIQKYAHEHRCRFIQLQNYIGDDTVVLEECETGLDEVRAALGLELFSYLSFDNSDMITEFIELSTNHAVKIIHAIADKRLTPCALVAGDIAMKGGLLHSPQWLRKEFFPNVKKLIDAWHEHEVKCLFHSDGYIMDIMPDLIEAGIDGLNPIETAAGMELKEVKRLYGNKIFITGGIDMSQLLSNGTPEEVRHVCRNAIEIASPGYFIGSTSELDNGAKLENILAMLEIAWCSIDMNLNW